MQSIFHRALGNDFHKLHPELQKKYGLTSKQNLMALGQGRMIEIRDANPIVRPFLQIGIRDHLVFGERGKNVPFTLENYFYKGDGGEETFSWVRRFFFPYSIRGFDSVMKYDEKKRKIIDEIGKSGILQIELDIHVTPEGGLFMESNQMTYKGKIPLPGPQTSVYEHYDEEAKAYRVHVHVDHPVFGTVMMYEGTVDTEFLPMTYNNIPDRGFLE
ncbi:DUF4166 domain-containing protein [Halobacillus fulvus]|nr:DUF4166 domain-containing protein [Halobacillus fulvus]